jgi:hypothetical protein
MNSYRARRILALFRPATADEQDPYFREARHLANTDAERLHWFNQDCEANLALRSKL